MSLYEYQAKEFLRGFGVPVPRGICCLTSEDAVSVASSLGGTSWVVKRQSSPLPRAAGDDIRIARNLREVRRFSNELLGEEGIAGRYLNNERMVRCLLVEEVVPVHQEYFVAMTRESRNKPPDLIVAVGNKPARAGMLPAHFTVERINPATGLSNALAARMATEIGIPAGSLPQAIAALRGLYHCYLKTDVLHAIIDPLALGEDGVIKALDVHFDCSDNGADFIHDRLLNRKSSHRPAKSIAA